MNFFLIKKFNNFKMNIKNNLIETIILISTLILLFYSSEPVMYSDSSRYLEGNFKDPPMYYTLVNLMNFIFGNLKSLIIFQTLFICFSIIHFTRSITKNFLISKLTKYLVSIFLFLPIIQFYNNLLTEALSYAFSLMFVSFSLRLIFNYKIKNLMWITLYATLLLLMRNQFLILYPVIIMLYIGVFVINKSKKTYNWFLSSLIIILISHNSVLYLNSFIKNSNFETKNLSYLKEGPYFFTYLDAIYISSKKDVKLFKNLNTQDTLSKIFEKMYEDKALIEHYNSRGHYGLSLKKIKTLSKPLLKDLAFKENKSVNTLRKEISIKLIRANFKKYLKHIFKKFYDSSWLFIFLPFLMLVSGLISFLKHKSKYSLFIIFISIFSLSNHSVIYLFGRVQPRYFIYTDFVLLISIFILFEIFLRKKKFN